MVALGSASARSRDDACPYGLLAQCHSLPALIAAQPVAPMYSDSTHQLWRCRTEAGELMLKVCHQARVDQSPTWQILRDLFGLYLPDDLADFAGVRDHLQRLMEFELPGVVACAARTSRTPAFILSRFLEGEMLSGGQVTAPMLAQLADHITGLHQACSPHWGSVLEAQQPAALWPEQLLKTLVTHAQRRGDCEPWLGLAVGQIDRVQHDRFAPVMLDLRWDQFLHRGGRITALVDLDAFVMAPPELELVLLEYLLDQTQADLFAAAYRQRLPMLDLTPLRLPYRLLLFLMNALGERDIDIWMRAPYRFQRPAL